MATFSERKGYKKVRTVLQVDDMDDALRTALWNALSAVLWERAPEQVDINGFIRRDGILFSVTFRLWEYSLKLPRDSFRIRWSDLYAELRGYFFSCHFNEVYDFIEATSQFLQNDGFDRVCNAALTREMSGYRLIGHTLTQLTSEKEVQEVESALHESPSPVVEHLKNALSKLADRKNPDYRNSIKESISPLSRSASSYPVTYPGLLTRH